MISVMAGRGLQDTNGTDQATGPGNVESYAFIGDPIFFGGAMYLQIAGTYLPDLQEGMA
jgi:hypothetical protein